MSCVKCLSCFDLPHRLQSACPACGLEPGPAPAIERAEVLCAGGMWEADDADEAKQAMERYMTSTVKECAYCLSKFRSSGEGHDWCCLTCQLSHYYDGLEEQGKRVRDFDPEVIETAIGDTRLCIHCGKEFVKLAPNQQACSDDCRNSRKLAHRPDEATLAQQKVQRAAELARKRVEAAKKKLAREKMLAREAARAAKRAAKKGTNK